MSLAWHIEALARAKKLPTLESMRSSKAAKQAPRKQSWETQAALLSTW